MTSFCSEPLEDSGGTAVLHVFKKEILNVIFIAEKTKQIKNTFCGLNNYNLKRYDEFPPNKMVQVIINKTK